MVVAEGNKVVNFCVSKGNGKNSHKIITKTRDGKYFATNM